MTEFLEMTVQEMMKKILRFKDGRYALLEKPKSHYDCIFLKDNKCSIYQVRPKQCRTFPWWVENLVSEESWKRAEKECEGISNEAPLVPHKEIKKNLSN